MGLTCPLSSISARPNRLLVERLDTAAFARRIIIPDAYRESRISCAALIRRVGSGCPSWATPDTQVILSTGRGKSLYIGARNETEWESIPPTFVYALVRDSSRDVEEPTETRRTPPDTFRDISPEDRGMGDLDLRDEEGY